MNNDVLNKQTLKEITDDLEKCLCLYKSIVDQSEVKIIYEKSDNEEEYSNKAIISLAGDYPYIDYWKHIEEFANKDYWALKHPVIKKLSKTFDELNASIKLGKQSKEIYQKGKVMFDSFDMIINP